MVQTNQGAVQDNYMETKTTTQNDNTNITEKHNKKGRAQVRVGQGTLENTGGF